MGSTSQAISSAHMLGASDRLGYRGVVLGGRWAAAMFPSAWPISWTSCRGGAHVVSSRGRQRRDVSGILMVAELGNRLGKQA